jgi:hypothetical protein
VFKYAHSGREVQWRHHQITLARGCNMNAKGRTSESVRPVKAKLELLDRLYLIVSVTVTLPPMALVVSEMMFLAWL